jgi:BirA family biotin operon repressor/biotin-[acetyl-CoA-carboxylase] ligase
LVEALSRHFLNHVHGWNEEGFRPVHEAWMRLAENVGGTINIMWQDTEVEGQFLSIDDEGNLILKTGDETTALPLAACVRRPGVAS